MRRSMMTTRGFHAPRPSGSHEPLADNTVSSSNSAAPPPPSVSTSCKASARGSATAGASSSPRRRSSDGGRKTSVTTAATGDTAVGPVNTTISPKGGCFSSLQAPRGLLSGHFSANHRRRISRRDAQAIPPASASTAATAARVPADTTTVVTAAAEHAAVPTSRDDRAATLGSGDTSLRCKRPRSPFLDDSDVGGTHDGDEATSPRSRATSTRSNSVGDKSDDATSLAQLRISRLPTARRFSTSHTPRTVFYPPSSERPVEFLRSSHDADGDGTMGAPESVLEPRVSSAPLAAGVHVTSEHTLHVHPWGSETAVLGGTGAGDALTLAPTTGTLWVPGSNPAVCVDREQCSSTTPVSEHPMTPLSAVMTAPRTTPSSTQSGERFLSVLQCQRRNDATALTTVPPSLPSLSLPYRSSCCTSASQLVSSAPPAVPSISKAAPSAPPSLSLPLLPCGPTSPLPAVPQLRVCNFDAPSFSSPRLERAVPLPSPSFVGGTLSPAIGLMPGQAGTFAAAAAAGGSEHQSLLSLAPPASVLDKLTCVPQQQEQQAPMIPFYALAAAEEAEREECDEVLEREMVEDLRMSTDIAFTPSVTGSGAPPLFSQSSMIQEEEEQATEEGGEAAVCMMRGRAVVTERADDNSGLHSGLMLSGQEGDACPVFRSQDDAAGQLIAGSPLSPRPVVTGTFDQHALLSCGGCGGGTSATDLSGVTPLSSSAGMFSPFTGPPSALSTWPIREATPPRFPAVSASGAGLLPLSAAASGGSGDLGVEGLGRGRHRTMFSFSSLRAGTAAASPLPGPLAVPPACLLQSPVETAADGLRANSRDVVVPAAERATPAVRLPSSEACTTAQPPDQRLPLTLEAARVSTPRDSLPLLVVCAGAKGEECIAQGASPTGIVAPTSTPLPWSDTLAPATGFPTLSSSCSTVPPLSDSYAAALPCLAAASGSSSATALPARPGRTCFTLHSVESVTATSSFSATATAVAKPTTAAAVAFTGAVPPGHTEAAYLPSVSCSTGSYSAELQQLPRRCSVPPRGTAVLADSAEGATDATPSGATRVLSSMESSDTTVCAQKSVTKAHPMLLRPMDSVPATVAVHRTPSASTSEEAMGNRGNFTLQQSQLPLPTAAVTERQQLWSSYNNNHPPASFTVTTVSPFVDRMNAEVPSAMAPQSAEAPTVHDETAQSHLRESKGMLFSSPLSPSQLPSLSLPRPTAAADDPAELFYDLPREVGHFYATRRSITSLYDWQHDLLTLPEVRQGGSFVYSLPTSGGKSLVAELSLLRCVLNRRKSCFLVLPFVSLAEEKTMALQPLTAAFDFNVDGHYGSSGRFPLCQAPAIYVCTIEKANSLLNHMLEEGRTEEIGAVVVDELHMVGEPRRGGTLELFLSKVLVINAMRQRQRDFVAAPASQGRQSACDTAPGRPEELEGVEENLHETAVLTGISRAAVDPGPLQIIGMSATVPNLRTIAEWLRAVCFECNFRPVPLRAYSVVCGLVLRDGHHNERNLSGSSTTQHLLELATEVPDASVLIFCASRQQCVDTARGIVNYLKAQAIASQKMPSAVMAGCSDVTVEAQHVSALGVPFSSLMKGQAPAAAVAAVPPQASPAIKSLLADLEALTHYEASQLSEVIPFGVAFHHGGLLAEERDLIETAFRRNHIRILCCTSTLAAGVNLPARRVIIKTPYVGREFLTKSRYLQMCGRAGRAGSNTYGESFLLLSSRDQARGHALMHACVEPCCSQLLEDNQTFTRSLLECVGVGLVVDRQSACQWSESLLSRWAVGPVDTVWQPFIAAAATSSASASSKGSSPTAAANGMRGSAADLFHASQLVYDDDNVAAQSSEGSRSAPAPPAPLPSQSASPSLPSLPCVPPAAMNAMVRASLATLARCGFIRIVDARSDSSSGSGNDIRSVTDTRADGSGSTATGAAAEKTSGSASSAALEALLSRVFDDSHADASAETHNACHVQVLVTPFGSSSVRSCFSIEEALLLRDELDELCHTGLILSDDLHLCYFLTPLREVGKCDWELLRLMMSRMSDSRQRIASLLGVDAFFVDQQAMGLGGPLEATDEGRRRLFTAKRFYVALMLADVLAEVPMATVEQRYDVSRGQLQNLMRSASMFSSSITSFCHAMEWFSLEAVLSSFVKRLGFGVKPDLLPLMEVRGMQPPRARALWNAGFKRLATIAAADAEDMVSKVKAMNPKDSKTAKFFTKRSALMTIREANLALQSQIQEKKGELQELAVRWGGGGVGLRGVR
ncbi:DEAD [Leishmania braziliensis]|nr:DEAD [Leishmania braziliensis]